MDFEAKHQKSALCTTLNKKIYRSKCYAFLYRAVGLVKRLSPLQYCRLSVEICSPRSREPLWFIFERPLVRTCFQSLRSLTVEFFEGYHANKAKPAKRIQIHKLFFFGFVVEYRKRLRSAVPTWSMLSGGHLTDWSASLWSRSSHAYAKPRGLLQDGPDRFNCAKPTQLRRFSWQSPHSSDKDFCFVHSNPNCTAISGSLQILPPLCMYQIRQALW